MKGHIDVQVSKVTYNQKSFLWTFLTLSFFLTLGHVRVNMNTLEITILSSHTQRGSKHVLGSTAVNKCLIFTCLGATISVLSATAGSTAKFYQTTPAQSPESCRGFSFTVFNEIQKIDEEPQYN